jgi:pimeloyl-ACP methyl ester carboxylesterase
MILLYIGLFFLLTRLDVGSPLQMMATGVDVAIFTPNLMRVHDNPILLESRSRERNVIPLFLGSCNDENEVTLSNLQTRLGARLHRSSNADELDTFLKKTLPTIIPTGDDKGEGKGDVRLVHCGPMPSALLRLQKGMNMEVMQVEDRLHREDMWREGEPTSTTSGSISDSMLFSERKKSLYVLCSVVLVWDGLFVSLSIYYCLPAFSDTIWHESNHHPPSTNHQSTQYSHYLLPYRYSGKALRERVPEPDMLMKGMSYLEPLTQTPAEKDKEKDKEEDEEARALRIVREYVVLGEFAFSEKYAAEYVKTASLSASHGKSMQRLLRALGEGTSSSNNENDLFTGEVCSGLLTQMAYKHGLVSPRLLVSARNPLLGQRGLWRATKGELMRADRPFTCQLREDAIRRDWHRHHIARESLREGDRASSSGSSRRRSPAGYYETFTESCGGKYLERTGVMPPSSSSSSSSEQQQQEQQQAAATPPLAVLIHGFGGSMDQMAGLGRELSAGGFEVLGVDLVGFGRSEKPPVSYNQYFWRDQVIQAVVRHQHQHQHQQQQQQQQQPASGGGGQGRANYPRKVIFCGNSIGGFTAASAAAAFADPVTTDTVGIVRSGPEHGEVEVEVEVAGLVLFNSAGRIIAQAPDEDTEQSGKGRIKIKSKNMKKKKTTTKLTLTVEEEMQPSSDKYQAKFYPPYSGPPGSLLRLFGSGLIAALQPRIRKTTEWLYPSIPEHIAASGLDRGILRDSLDPGARDVMASGAKLPAPLSMDSLFQCYRGPVLVAQGALDPLNDAVARAAQFQAIRDGVSVQLLQLGHCPMDEDPQQCAAAVLKWWQQEQGQASRREVEEQQIGRKMAESTM